jgi:hypothetical protein
MPLTALEVDVAAAEEDVDGLADAIEQIVGSGFDGADAVEFGADEIGTFAAHGAGEVALTLLLRAAGNGCTGLQEVKACGADLFGHQRLRPHGTSKARQAICQSEAEPR